MSERNQSLAPLREMRLNASQLCGGRVEYLPEGGALTYFDNQKYPVHGIPTDEGLWVAEMVKKYVIAWLVFFGKSPQKYLMVLCSPILIFFFRRIFRDWLKEFTRYVDSIAVKYNRPDLFSPAVRHLYDTLIELWPEENFAIIAICIFLEQDKYYRYVFQDLAMAVRKDQLILHPATEFSRILNVYLTREQRVKYKSLGWVLKFFLWTQPGARRAASLFAERADFQKFYFDNYDLWAAFQSQAGDSFDYAFGGKTQEQIRIDFAKM